VAGGERFRPSIDERWAELLRRYGRWGPMTLTDLDLKVVSGYGLTAQGDYLRAVAVTQEALAETDDPEKLGELYQVLATAYYFQGYRQQKDRLAVYDMNYIRLSAEAYEQAIRYRPQVISFGNLGWTYYLLGEYRLAEQYSLRALAFDDSLDYVRLNLGLLYMVQGEFRKSYHFYRRVAVRFPTDEVYLGGITDLKEVLRDLPGKHPFAHLMIGYLSLQRGDLPEARRNLRAFLSSPEGGADWRRQAERWLVDPASALEG
jgi:tetratricopeptide (TPR) repeat protein